MEVVVDESESPRVEVVAKIKISSRQNYKKYLYNYVKMDSAKQYLGEFVHLFSRPRLLVLQVLNLVLIVMT